MKAPRSQWSIFRSYLARIALSAGACFALAAVSRRVDAGLVNTNVYTDFTYHIGSGDDFLGSPVAAISTPDLEQFGAAVSWNWHPNGLQTFGADSVGYIDVPPSPADFTFIMSGTQDEFLFIDGVRQFEHNSFFVGQSQTSLPLSAGIHKLEVQYATTNPPGSQSGYELQITPPNGSSFSFVAAPVPEPTSALLFAAGAIGVVAMLRRRKMTPSCQQF